MIEDVLLACGLRPREIFQLACINNGITCATFDDPVTAWTWVGEHSGNFYICGNPLRAHKSSKASNEDVLVSRCLLLDADPEKTGADPHGLSEESRTACLAFVEDVKAWIAQDMPVVDSGRGYQLWIQTDVKDRRGFLQRLALKFKRPGVVVDATHDPSRLMRLPGTINQKTGRTAKLINSLPTFWVPCSQAMVDTLPPLPLADTPTAPPVALRLRAQGIWDEPVGVDASKRDARFFLELLREGKTESEAWSLLCALPGGKAAGGRRDESYRNSTVEWARRAFDVDARALATCRKLKYADACEPASVAALTRLRSLRPKRFKVTMERLKAAGADMATLKTALKAHAAATAAAEVDFIRHAAEDGKGIGWWIWANAWNSYKFNEFASILRGRGLSPDAVVDAQTADPWTLVNVPFGPTETGRRLWNRNPAAFSCTPAAGTHPMWDQVLRVCGRSLDGLWPAGGADYLLRWIASVFQRPLTKLPWLFFHGKENVGKSTFHECLKLLLKRGYVEANAAILSPQGFNKEMAGAVICVVEEIELKKEAHRRIKLWTTGENLSVHEKGCTPYGIDNSTHWIQTGNKLTDCPLMVGDTRITAVRVDAPDPADVVSKEEILRRCLAEAPAFIATCMALGLEPMVGRLGLPVLETSEKAAQQAANRTELEVWLDAHPEWISKSDDDVSRLFLASLERPGDWDRSRVVREIPNTQERELAKGLRGIQSFKGSAGELGKAILWSRSLQSLGVLLLKGLPGWKITVEQARGHSTWAISAE